MSERGRAEVGRLRELAWGLAHGKAALTVFVNTNSKYSWRNWSFISHGFKSAADELAAIALDRWPKSDYLWFPLSYTYRHFVETSLKGLLAETFGASIRNTHSLPALWNECRENIESVLSDEETEHTCDQISAVIEHLNTCDPKSVRFRYPAEPSQVDFDINIPQLVYFMELFDFCIDFIKEEVERRQETTGGE